MTSRLTRVLGWATLIALGITVWLALFVSPADVNQKDAVRLLYLHVPTAWIAMYVSFGVTTVASILWLWKKTRSPKWDLLAGASAEIGVLFIGLTLIIGSIWGKTTWGVWWTWDARLTLTAVLFVLYLGYLAVRRAPAAPDVRSKRAAFVALAAAVDIPVVHYAVEWWRTLHQPATIMSERRLLDPEIHGSMATTLWVGVLAFTLLYAWLVVKRYRLARMEQQIEDQQLDVAIADRQAEAEEAGLAVPT